jgi:hypothetical protein
MDWRAALGVAADVAQLASLLPLVVLVRELRRQHSAQKELDALVAMLQETDPGLWVSFPTDRPGVALGLKSGILRGRYNHGRLYVCIAHDPPVAGPHAFLR